MRNDTSWTGHLLDTQIAQSPLAFIRNGNYTYNFGNIAAPGNTGYYWQSRYHSGANANFLYFYSFGFSSQSNRDKGYGNSIRCLVR